YPRHTREIQRYFLLAALNLLDGVFNRHCIGYHTHDHSFSATRSDTPAPRPRYALHNNSTNSLTIGIRGLERHEGSSKAIFAKSGSALSKSGCEIPNSAIERGICNRSSNCSVADTRFFPFSATVSPPRPSKSATMAYFLCATYPRWFGDGMNLVGTDA